MLQLPIPANLVGQKRTHQALGPSSGNNIEEVSPAEMKARERIQTEDGPNNANMQTLTNIGFALGDKIALAASSDKQ